MTDTSPVPHHTCCCFPSQPPSWPLPPSSVTARAAALTATDCFCLLLAVKITAVRHPTSGREHQPPGHRPGQRGHGAQVISAVPELHLSVNIEGLFIVGLNSTLKEPTVHCFQSEEKPCNEKKLN